MSEPFEPYMHDRDDPQHPMNLSRQDIIIQQLQIKIIGLRKLLDEVVGDCRDNYFGESYNCRWCYANLDNGGKHTPNCLITRIKKARANTT